MNNERLFRKRGKTWSFTLDIGKDAQGKRKQKTKGGFKTKKAAEEACAELIARAKGEYVEPSKSTLGEYLQEWIDSSAKQTMRDTTLDTHQIVIDKHINPELGQIKLSEVTPVRIQKFHSKKLEEGFWDYVRICTPSSINP